MKKIQIIKIFLLIFLLFYINPVEAQTEKKCNWEAGVQSGGGGTIKCLNKRLADDTECSPRPAGAMYTFYDCCCSTVAAAASAPTSKAPLIKVPIPEIKIPTVELSEVTCPPDGQGGYTCSIPWIGEYINGIYKYGINIAGILAALVLMGGGLLWLISGGDASKITQAKDMIIGSITGLIILMSSYIILTQINPDLVKMKSISLGYISKMESPEGAIGSEKTPIIRKTTEYIIVHTAAGLATRDQVDKYHKSLGWRGIGYNFYVERNGTVSVGRPEDESGAHSIKYNSKSIGISYSGCADTSMWYQQSLDVATKNGTITQGQLNALVTKIKALQVKYKIPRDHVLGHYEEPVNKACPCLKMDELRSLINP